MKSAHDLAREIINAVALGSPAPEHGDAGNVGAAFLDGLAALMRDSDRDGRKQLRRLARIIHDQASNLDYDIQANGEAGLVRAVCRPGDVVFDVGANQGDWTRAVLAACPDARVHCFELIPATAKRLSEALADRDKVLVNGFGLGAEEGRVEANYCPERSELSGLYAVHGDRAMERVSCRISTGDGYCARLKVDDLRLLKVDCEGAEYAVLQGFRSAIKTHRIRVVQFEYGKANIAARVLLRDLYGLLEGCGYVLGKLYPDGVDFGPYALDLEDFTGPNYVACLGRDRELVDRLSRF